MSYEVQPEFPPAPQLQVYGDAPEQTSELDEHHDDGAYDVDDQPCVDEDEYLDQATRVRRPKLVVAMAMFSLALAGTTAAFGYRAMISGALLAAVPPIIKATNQPIKIEPASDEPHAKNATDEVDTVTTGSIEKLVSREEQPVRIVPPKPASRMISTIPITTRQDSLTRVGPPARRACGHAGGTEPRDVGPRSGCCSYVAECGAIKCRGRHRCIDQRAFGCRANSTCQRQQQQCGGNPFCFWGWLRGSSYVGAQ